MEYDFIIVGQGLAGTCLAHSLEKRNASFKVINYNEESCSSKVAAGIFNPITGKRLVKTWMADQIFPFAMEFYAELEQILNVEVVRNLNVYKPYADVAEENDVTGKSAEEHFAKYVNLNFDHSLLQDQIVNDKGGVEIVKSGNLRLSVLIDAYQQYLIEKEAYLNEQFDYSKLQINDEGVSYGDISAKKIVFCEGHQAVDNPFFSWLPFTLTKGEILEISIPGFQKERIINRGGFVLPLDNGNYLAGASYERKIDKQISDKGLGIVKEKIDGFLKMDYQVVGRRVGIRPTVRDRRPFLGALPDNEKIVIFNGLGTKGVTIGPWFSDHFASHLVKGNEIMKEANISRYYSLSFENTSNVK